MDWVERNRRINEGYPVHWARQDARLHGKAYEEACELHCRAAKDASVCGEGFRPLAPTDSVTMEHRKVGRNAVVRVPVCLLCSIGSVQHYRYRRGSGMEDWYSKPHWRRTRCLGCGRLLRIPFDSERTTPLALSECACCGDCARAVRNERNKLRRRITQDPKVCRNPNCGRAFIPKRADAVTCSERCRQALHRARACQLSVMERDVTDN